MVRSGAPRCPRCGADLGWGEVICPYCGTSLGPQRPALPGGLLSGPFPRELHVETRGRWRVRYRLFDDDLLLGVFTQRWHGGVEFLSAQGRLYYTTRAGVVRLTLRWMCAGDVVAWAEQVRPWVRRYRLRYGGASYFLESLSPVSAAFRLHDGEEHLLLQVASAGLFRAPGLTVHAPLSLELVALVYAAVLTLRR